MVGFRSSKDNGACIIDDAPRFFGEVQGSVKSPHSDQDMSWKSRLPRCFTRRVLLFCWLAVAALSVAGCLSRRPRDYTREAFSYTRTSTPLTWSTATATAFIPASTKILARPTCTPFPTPTATRVVRIPSLTPSPQMRTPSPQNTSTSAIVSHVNAWEGTITLNSYGWEAALVGTTPDDPIYPYPRLNRDLVKPPVPHIYKTIALENEYTRLTLLPELGGRLYRWLDKPSEQEMFYINPVIKPTQWGARGWWFATGGMEWAFPVEEHGFIEWRPWNCRFDSGADWASATLVNRDDRTGLIIEIVVVLEAGHSYITIRPHIHNPTGAEQSYQFWLNGMFALSPTNQPSPDLRFTLPGDSVTIHSTGDGALPIAGEEMNWPVFSGRDMSRYGNWNGWLGIFGWNGGYMGAYDPASDMGVVRVFPSDISRGAKIFGPGNLAPDLWTDDNSGYVELWGGLTRTFWDYATLPPGGSIGWQERWYSLNSLGGLSYANDEAALWLAPGGEEVQVGVFVTKPMVGQVVLWRSGQIAMAWDAAIAPGAPFRGSYPISGNEDWGLQFIDGSGKKIATCGTF